MTSTVELPDPFLGSLDESERRTFTLILGAPTSLFVDWQDDNELHLWAAFEELGDWVHWLTRTYQLDMRVVPECWMKHESMLWELSSLHTSWLGVFRRGQRNPGPDRPLEWHVAFAASRIRLREWAGRSRCRAGAHRP